VAFVLIRLSGSATQW